MGARFTPAAEHFGDVLSQRCHAGYADLRPLSGSQGFCAVPGQVSRSEVSPPSGQPFWHTGMLDGSAAAAVSPEPGNPGGSDGMLSG